MDTLTGRKRLNAALSVEGALMIPLFFLAFMPFLLLLRLMIAQVSIEDALQTSLRRMALDSYLLERSQTLPEEESLVVNLAQQAVLKAMMQSNLEGMDLEAYGVEGGWDGVSLLGSRFYYEDEGHTYLMKGVARITYHNPFSFWTLPKGYAVSITRCFLGASGKEAGMEAGGETPREEPETVYIIGEGVHYHQYDCYLIQKTVVCLPLESARLAGYVPCRHCIAEGSTSGGQVYVTAGGEHYHTSRCHYLFPNVWELAYAEALARGYGPCGICFGTQGYFR